MKFIKSLRDGNFLEVFLVDHLYSFVIKDNNSIAVCCNLSLKSLVLLNLCLKVGWVFVVLIAGCLKLLMYPCIKFISISAEVYVPSVVSIFLKY